MSAPVPRRLRKVVKVAEAAGWTFDTTKGGHPRLSPPRGLRDAHGELVGQVLFSSTPSDKRGDRNSCARLRRAGVNVDRVG